MTTFPLNAWYVAATAQEVAAQPLGRKIAGNDMVFFRDEHGDITCLEDFCPHRGLPLSMGSLQNGVITCGYHGLQMGAGGRVLAMPNQRVDRFPCVKVYAVIERHGYVWVWPGDPELADESDIADYPWASSSGWTFGGGEYHIDCDYRLMIDNLMDLTHETYVHRGSIGQAEIDTAPVDTQIEGSAITTSRFIKGITAPPLWQMALEANNLDPNTLVDRWQVSRFTPPGNIMIEVGVARAGCGGIDANDEDKVGAVVVDFVTPENENSMWYFWGMGRNFKPESASLTEEIREGQRTIFAEDIAILERQQISVDNNAGRRLLTLNIDSGGRHARRVLQNLVTDEIGGDKPASEN